MRLNVISTFIQRYMDVMDVRWTLLSRFEQAGKGTHLFVHNVVSTFIQPYMDVMDVRWTLLRRFVLAFKGRDPVPSWYTTLFERSYDVICLI